MTDRTVVIALVAIAIVAITGCGGNDTVSDRDLCAAIREIGDEVNIDDCVAEGDGELLRKEFDADEKSYLAGEPLEYEGVFLGMARAGVNPEYMHRLERRCRDSPKGKSGAVDCTIDP